MTLGAKSSQLRNTGTALATLVLTISMSTTPRVAAQDAPALTTEAAEQILALLVEKVSRTPAQHKISSPLLFELDRRRPRGHLRELPQLRTRAEVAADGTVLVDMSAEVSPALLARIEALGGQVISSFAQYRAIRARLPLTALERLAEHAAVSTIRPADRYMTQMINTTEGDVAHGTDTVRTNLGIDGTGVAVGAMSDSVDALGSLQASGDLPPVVTVLPGQSGNPGTSEGTALLEIIHDMAPGADLFFATGQGGQAQMAQNILDLQAAGCDVITDDVLYFAEPVFQDGIIAQAVDTVVVAGTMYFTSAGNSGNLDSGTAGVWEGDYSPTAIPPPLAGNGVSAHDFGNGNSNEVTVDTPFFITLQWANPTGAADDDYDLFLLDAAMTTVLDASTNTQDGTQDPFEFIDSTADDDTGNRVVVLQFAGDDAFLHVNTHRGQLAEATDGQIFGHPGAAGAMTVAAVNVATAGGGVFTGGPANPVEVFSSDGPRRIFFNPDGSPVVPPTEGPTTPPSIVRDKPDVTAADGVSTATPGFDPFFGTSASAPHSAAIAALYDELFPSVSIPNAYDIFRSSALDIDEFGFDRNSGAGIIMMEESANNTIFADGFESGDATAWTDSTD